jgi:CheY-like chemotaxis protein
VLTALVVDPSPAARRRVGALLTLGGWHVVHAADAGQALRAATTHELDLIVTEVDLPGETGLSLLARLRAAGCSARLLVVTEEPSERIRSAAAGVGALTCLAKPIDPWALIDLLRRRATAPARHLRVVSAVEDSCADSSADSYADGVDGDTMGRLRQMFFTALPHRVALIADHARAGDAMAVAWAAQTLAGASGQLGHAPIAVLCQEIAADARRGVLSRSRLVRLEALSGAAIRGNRTAGRQLVVAERLQATSR